MSDELTLNVVYQYPRYSGIFLDTEKDTSIPISIEKIREGLGLHFNVDINLVKTYSRNIASIDSKCKKCKYYTCRGTNGSKKPWYGMSVNEKEYLEKEEIKQVVFLFWGEKEKNGYTPFYSAEISFDEIENFKSGTENRYRFNFEPKNGGYVCNSKGKEIVMKPASNKKGENKKVRMKEAMGSNEYK